MIDIPGTRLSTTSDQDLKINNKSTAHPNKDSHGVILVATICPSIQATKQVLRRFSIVIKFILN